MNEKEAEDLGPNRLIEELPVVGQLDQQIRSKGEDLGLLFVLGATNVGAGLGAFTIATGSDPILLGTIWLVMGVGLLAYTIYGRGD